MDIGRLFLRALVSQKVPIHRAVSFDFALPISAPDKAYPKPESAQSFL
jgi:hypothetical protein